MRRATTVLTTLALLVGCAPGEPIQGNQNPDYFRYVHDAEHDVGCWVYWGYGIDCLPDSEYRVSP